MSNCIKCPNGTFSAFSGANSSLTCSDCPIGSYSNQIGRDSCILCPANTYSTSTKSINCQPCPSSKICSLGTIYPLSVSIAAQSQLKDDPFFSTANKGSAASSNTIGNIAKIVILVLFVLIILQLLLTAGLFGMLHWKWNILGNSKIQWIRNKLDTFSMRHNVALGESPKNQPMWLGVLGTALVAVTMIALAIVFALDAERSVNITNRISTFFGANLPRDLVTIPTRGNQTVNIELVNFVGDCRMKSSVAPFGFNIDVSGYDFNSSVTKNVTYDSITGTCFLSFSCLNCDFGSKLIYATFSAPASAAQVIKYNISIPHYYEKKNTNVIEQLAYKDGSLVFVPGDKATTVALSLVPSYFTRAPDDVFFYGIFTRQSVADLTTVSLNFLLFFFSSYSLTQIFFLCKILLIVWVYC